MNLFGNTIAMSAKSLDFLWGKQQATLHNLANVDTPGYKSQYVTFEEEFKSRLQAASKLKQGSSVESAIRGSSYQIHTDESESARLDGNNVHTDVQNVELARTSLQYQYTLQSVNSDISRLRAVIKGQ